MTVSLWGNMFLTFPTDSHCGSCQGFVWHAEIRLILQLSHSDIVGRAPGTSLFDHFGRLHEEHKEKAKSGSQVNTQDHA